MMGSGDIKVYILYIYTNEAKKKYIWLKISSLFAKMSSLFGLLNTYMAIYPYYLYYALKKINYVSINFCTYLSKYLDTYLCFNYLDIKHNKILGIYETFGTFIISI